MTDRARQGREATIAAADDADPAFVDLGEIEPAMAGPKRPEGRVPLEGIAAGFAAGAENATILPAEVNSMLSLAIRTKLSSPVFSVPSMRIRSATMTLPR